MKAELEQKVAKACQELFDAEVAIDLTRPEEQFGDYSTNVALQLSKQLGRNPREIGEALVVKLRETLAEQVSEISVAGPGFVNLKLNDPTLIQAAAQEPAKANEGQEIVIEFGDPNPFKEMHLGHLYTAIAGDTIARLFEVSGARVERVSYHGDVGMHVAKAIWAMRKHLNETQDIAQFFSSDTVMGRYYAEGAQAFEADQAAAEEIKQVNASVYARDDETINNIYDAGRELSFRNFDKIFRSIGVNFSKRYLESESSELGLEVVRQHTGKVFEESDGAVVYKGEKVGLHTRVFINSRGLPTYETKDLGLAELKHRDYPNANRSIIITAHEQTEYFKVMLAALAEIDAELAAKTSHLAHGFLSLTTGKMSSRTGQVLGAAELLEDVLETVSEQFLGSAAKGEVYLAAVKYTFLKNRIGGDIIFDIKESVALEGNSGPYLQYAHARAKSILSKAGGQSAALAGELQADERSLVRKISEYPEVVDKAVAELMPHHVCSYLYELAQTFNRFYERNRVIDDERQALRLGLVERYAQTLANGLQLLGIAAPDKM